MSAVFRAVRNTWIESAPSLPRCGNDGAPGCTGGTGALRAGRCHAEQRRRQDDCNAGHGRAWLTM
ncbi:MAG: hypothetical protein K6T87_06995 [Roseiflexus sp.]|uniref:hypothetical protein n=1 Tax=Roseiflexus sp. TaxID=2562120 RepID=UPI0025E2C3EC|nr:hypothetical protein [Roseiflexus sp.]MCL6540319.1 hypothetical protein [Roseiflexus sp.]